MLYLAEATARALCADAFGRAGFRPTRRPTCTDAVLFASLRGLDSHGIVSVLPAICRAVSEGRIEPGAAIQQPGPLVLKGNGAAGPVIGARTMRVAMGPPGRRASAPAVAFNCNHFGAASYYAVLALEKGLIGVCACNAGPNVAPYGGAQPLHGTNPLAYAFPAGDEPRWCWTSPPASPPSARWPKPAGGARRCPRAGPWTPSGQPTTDPARTTTLLPFGGHKGYGIGVMVDLLTAGLTGSTVGVEVRQGDNDREHAGQSFFMLAIDPVAFGGATAFAGRRGRARPPGPRPAPCPTASTRC